MSDTLFDVEILPEPETSLDVGADDSTPRPFQVFLGGGVRAFSRGVNGLDLQWFNVSLHTGTEYSHWFEKDNRIFVVGRVGGNIYTRAEVSVAGIDLGGTSLEPESGGLARIDVGWEYKALHVTGFADWSSWGQATSDAGFIQPESAMTRIGLNVGFRW